MYLNNYSVRILGGNEVPGGYVEVLHGTKFSIILRNDNSIRCDAHVEVNGVHVGTWRVNPHTSAILQRPANDDGYFTFYRAGSSEASAVMPVGGAPAAGLIQVTFTPEKVPEYVPQIAIPPYPKYTFTYTSTSGTMRSAVEKGVTTSASSSRSAGVIGQSGHSSQQYGVAADIEYDYTGQTIISLRLVAIDDNSPRPLTQFGNPVPPPLR